MPLLPLQFPFESLTDAYISPTAAIQAKKLITGRSLGGQLFARATTIAAVTQEIYIVNGASGAVLSFSAMITGAIATGADRTVTVDLLKSTGAGAFATILTTPLAFSNASVLRTYTTCAPLTASLLAGDALAITVAVAGVAANQALGLCWGLTFYEAYS